MLIWATLTFFLLSSQDTSSAKQPLDIYDYTVVEVYPHDTSAFTQGLLFSEGYLYESTGLWGESKIRKVSLESGKPIQNKDLEDQYFGEGLVKWNDKLIGLTWKAGKGFIYNLDDFSVEKTFSYDGEGWGLTHNGQNIIMSDGTSELRFLNPDSLQEEKRITVHLNDKPISNLNELEWVQGEVFANIYQTNLVARIDPSSGQLTGIIDFTGLLLKEDIVPGHTNVLNGIAYDEASNRLFVTGKRWPKLFEVSLQTREKKN